jgi:hypothetical protein
MTSLLFAALALTMTQSSLAQVPPTPCPSTPANYCDCGEGDHGFKFLCRANNGYTWETNEKVTASVGLWRL